MRQQKPDQLLHRLRKRTGLWVSGYNVKGKRRIEGIRAEGVPLVVGIAWYKRISSPLFNI